MKILVVDDNPVQRLAAEQTLVGHEVTIVNGFDAAVEEIKKEKMEKVLSKASPPREAFSWPKIL